MTREEASLDLDATTLRPQDASPEARALLESDAGIAAWHAQRTAFDESVSAAFPTTVPPGLRDSLLESVKPAVYRRRLRWPLAVFATAAAACVAVGFAMFLPAHGDMPAWQAESLAAVIKVEHGMARLDQRAPDLDAVRGLLAATHSPSPGRLPGTIATRPTFGCKRIQVAGRPATIICFRLDGGKEAHLVVINDASDASDVPPTPPRLETRDRWHMASWKNGRQTYLLATSAGEKELKQLLGLT